MAPPLPSTFVSSQGSSDGEPVLYQPQRQHIPRDAEEYPVLRIFGSTPGGQKTCAHIHGSLPYLLARPSYNEESGNNGKAGRGLLHAFDNASILKTWTKRLVAEISAKLDSTLVFLSKRSDEETGGGDHYDCEEPPKTAQQYIQRPLVYSIDVVERIPIYGFHPKELPYLKITLFNPKHISLLAGVLRSGVIQGVEMQPHEAHINNILQALIDHDVGGMDYLHLRGCKFRSPMPEMPGRTAAGTSQSPSSRGTPATPFSLSTSPGSMSSSRSPAKRRLRKSPASPFTGRNEHRLWWAHNTPSKLVQDYSHGDHEHSTHGQESETYPAEQTASQLMRGIDPRDFELSQAVYGGAKKHEESLLGKDSELPELEPTFSDEPPPRPPDHLSRSRCSLEIDATIYHILNRSMCTGKDVPANDAAPKSTKKSFHAVNSLTGMWAEERDRARRLGLSSQIDAPTEATPPDGNVVNRGLASAGEFEAWKKTILDLASKSSDTASSRPTTYPQEENMEPSVEAEVERVLASQASFEALSRKSRRAEYRVIHENGDEENEEEESEDSSDEDSDSSDNKSSSQVFTQLSQSSITSDNVESNKKSATSSQLKRRNSSFLTQEQQRHIEIMLSQDEPVASKEPLAHSEKAPDQNFCGVSSPYEDLLTAEEDEERWWLSQPQRRETINQSEVYGHDGIAIDAGGSPISPHLSIESNTLEHINLAYEYSAMKELYEGVVEDSATLQGTNLVNDNGNRSEDEVDFTSERLGDHGLPGRSYLERESLECPSQLFSLTSSPDNTPIYDTGSERLEISKNPLNVLRPSVEPPSSAHVVATLYDYGLQFEVPVEPFFSVRTDVQTAPLPNHSRRRVLPKFRDDLPCFDTTPQRQLFHDKRHHQRICSRQRTAKRLALGLEKQRHMKLSNGSASMPFPTRVGQNGIWLIPLLPLPPSSEAVTSWLQGHSLDEHTLKSASLAKSALSVNPQVPRALDSVDEHDHSDDDDEEEFTMDANTGKMIPTLRPKRRKLFNAQRNAGERSAPLAKDASNLDMSSEEHAHPLFVTNPERARANGYPITAQFALEIRRSVLERQNSSSNASLSMPPPPPSPMKASSPVKPPVLPRPSSMGFVTAHRARTPSSLFRQVSQVPLPTQSPHSSCASGEVANGGGNRRAAPESFHLTGSGSTVSSSVGRRVSVLCIEVVGATRHQLLPDPEVDAALFVCWRLLDTFGFDAETEEHHRASGAILNLAPQVVGHGSLDRNNSSSGAGTPLQQHTAEQSWHRALGEGVDVVECGSELELFLEVEALFELYDPVLSARALAIFKFINLL